jgi:hypothetical protein
MGCEARILNALGKRLEAIIGDHRFYFLGFDLKYVAVPDVFTGGAIYMRKGSW